jgi:hypothetical protein
MKKKKHLFLDISSTNIDTLVPSLYQCVETRSIEVFDSCLSHFRTWSGIMCVFRTSLRQFIDSIVNRFTRQTLPTVNRKHFFINTLCIESFCPQKKTHNRTLLLGGTLLKHGHHFNYWNQPLNIRMRVCYPDCHEAGQCCYLVIHTENLLRPLQLFYFIGDLFTDSPSYFSLISSIFHSEWCVETDVQWHLPLITRTNSQQ